MAHSASKLRVRGGRPAARRPALEISRDRLSAQTRARLANAELVIESVASHGEDVATGLDAHNAELPADEQLSREAILAFLRWLAAALRSRNQALAIAESSYAAEQHGDPAERAQRNQLAPALYTRATRARERVASVLGEDALPIYGMRRPVPRHPGQLVDYVEVAVRLLRKHARREDDGIGSTLDTTVLADKLSEAMDPLRLALSDFAAERRRREGALACCSDVTSAWRNAYHDIATALTGLYRMSGHRDLAERVQPTPRRSAGAEAPPKPDEPDEE